ncbi:hypothetical protein, partial [Shewanella sp. 0m-4]
SQRRVDYCSCIIDTSVIHDGRPPLSLARNCIHAFWHSANPFALLSRYEGQLYCSCKNSILVVTASPFSSNTNPS